MFALNTILERGVSYGKRLCVDDVNQLIRKTVLPLSLKPEYYYLPLMVMAVMMRTTVTVAWDY